LGGCDLSEGKQQGVGIIPMPWPSLGHINRPSPGTLHLYRHLTNSRLPTQPHRALAFSQNMRTRFYPKAVAFVPCGHVLFEFEFNAQCA
jgi:hypothetical protein